MAFPFAKTNCYLASTRTPWIVRWPGRTKPGTVDDRHFISGIDFMPTILDATRTPHVEGMDGRSFLPLLLGHAQAGRDQVYTTFHRTAGKRDYPMRCLQTRRFGYIFSPWSDGKTVFLNESQSGRSFKAIQDAAEDHPDIARRLRLFQYRVPEELYDFENDPHATVNLIGDDRYASILAQLRTDMAATMSETHDPLLAEFQSKVIERR
jgi:N-sulfoglucosamine sulfohydrolase